MKNDDRTRFTLRLPKRLFEMLQHDANATGVSVNALLLQILWQWLEQRG